VPLWRAAGGPGGPCNFNRGPRSKQHWGRAEIDPRRTGIVCAQRRIVEGEVGKQRKTFVGASPTLSCFQVQPELSRLDCRNHDCDCRNKKARYVQARRSPDRQVEEHTPQHDAQIYTNDSSKLSRSLSRESSQRTAVEVEQQPAAPKTEPVSLRGVRPSEEEQGHSLGIGLA
jgi:hypothetical protein